MFDDQDRCMVDAIAMRCRHAYVAAAVAATAACASAPAQPVRAPEPGSFCPVTVQNGTSYVLDVSYSSPAQRPRSLGPLSPGDSYDVSVPCDDRHVSASGVAQGVSPGQGRLRFQRSIRIAGSERTQLTLRSSDQQR